MDVSNISIFLFINGSSGGGQGQKLLSQEVQKVEFDMDLKARDSTKQISALVSVYFFNLRKKKQRGFKILRQCVEKGSQTIAVACGGDGTVTWVGEELAKVGVQRKTPLAIIPLGTGNDFSQYLGWGREKQGLTQGGFRGLKKLIRRWLAARQEQFDLWEVVAQTQQYGKFERVGKDGRSQNIEGKVFQHSFCNYFSFGIDGKIGYNFDKHRSSSRLGNLILYGALGMIKSATKTKTIRQLLIDIQQRPQLSDYSIEREEPTKPPIQNLRDNSPHTSTISKQTKERVIFSTRGKGEKKQKGSLQLQGDFYNVVALNIDSYMGGVKDIWKNAKGSPADQPSTWDGRLEMLGFSSSLGMAMERVVGGFASRITQGGGPYLMRFRQYPNQPKHRTYLQVDGQFIRFTSPKSILIRKSPISIDGKIRVLRREPNAE